MKRESIQDYVGTKLQADFLCVRFEVPFISVVFEHCIEYVYYSLKKKTIRLT